MLLIIFRLLHELAIRRVSHIEVFTCIINALASEMTQDTRVFTTN